MHQPILLEKQTSVLPSDNSIPGKTITYFYDGIGNIIKTKDTLDVENLYVYDKQSRLISYTKRKSDGTQAITTSKKYDAVGNLRYETDGNDNLREKTYNAINKQISETISGTSYLKLLAYDLNGNVLSETDEFGNTVSFEYDPLNRMIKKKNAENIVVETLSYNANNVQIASTDALGNTTTFNYDKNNRLISTTDAMNHTTSQIYDNAGNIVEKIDGNGNKTIYTFDELGNTKTSALGTLEVNSFTYDNNGNMLTQTNGNGHMITYTYNSHNLPVTIIQHGGVGIPRKTEQYTYDADGNNISKTDRNGNIINYSYDIHGRQTGVTSSDINISKEYDDNSNVTVMNDNSGQTIRTYDALNRVLSKTISNIGTSYYQYDIVENVPEGHRAEVTTDPKGNTTIKVFDKNDRLIQVKDGANVIVATYSYYNDGRQNSVVNSNGSGEYYTYNSDGTLSSLINKNVDGTNVDEYTYVYDSARNIVSKNEIINGISYGTTSYTYDYANRVISVILASRAHHIDETEIPYAEMFKAKMRCPVCGTEIVMMIDKERISSIREEIYLFCKIAEDAGIEIKYVKNKISSKDVIKEYESSI